MDNAFFGFHLIIDHLIDDIINYRVQLLARVLSAWDMHLAQLQLLNLIFEVCFCATKIYTMSFYLNYPQCECHMSSDYFIPSGCLFPCYWPTPPMDFSRHSRVIGLKKDPWMGIIHESGATYVSP